MNRADWEERWGEGRIAFHQPGVSYALERYGAKAFGNPPIGCVYVPLCGKSLDMVYLADIADEVLGSEYVEQAAREFFAEQQLTPDVSDDLPLRYSSRNYTIFVADFFTVTADHLGRIDAVLDRAALVALDGEARVRYAEHMRTLLRPGARTLLVTLDYNQAEMTGPPFAVSPDEVLRLFSSGFEIEHLDTRDVLDDNFRSRGLSALRESAFILTRLLNDS